MPGAGVPYKRAIPPLVSVNVTPLGKLPLWVIVIGDEPVAVISNAPAPPTVKMILSALVMTGASATVRVKDCVASGAAPLLAVMVRGYVPLLPAVGDPDRVAVPSPLSIKDTPAGRLPVSLMLVVLGTPAVVVTVNDPGMLTTNNVLSALVMAGDVAAALTVRIRKLLIV